MRELRNVIERACLLSNGVIAPEHLLLPEAAAPPPASSSPPAVTPLAAAAPATGVRLRDAERATILRVLELHGGNRTRAAAELGISVRTLYNKLKRFELDGTR